MANPAGFGADQAYDRAVAAYEQKSYDVARRWVLEALAQNPEHAQARALLGRLDSIRRPPSPAAAPRPASPYGHGSQPAGPEIVSTDPTVLINNASRTPTAEPIEPTVLVRREDRARRPPAPAPEPFPPPAPAPPPYRPSVHDTAPGVADPTVIRRPSDPPPARQKPPASPGFLQSWLGRSKASGTAAPRRSAPAGSGGISPGMRGAALVVGAVVAAGLLLIGGIAIVRWLSPGGQTLTITPPTGGTIVGPGIRCGTNGRDCSTTRPLNEVVQLEREPDTGYVFNAFTGDCPISGRLVMTQARQCGAVFDKTGTGTPDGGGVKFTLTLQKPVGGNIVVGEYDLMCGSLGIACSAEVPSGTRVTIHQQSDVGFTFQSWLGDCAPNGEMIMNAPKNCSVAFLNTPGAVVVNNPDVPKPVTPKPPREHVVPPPPKATPDQTDKPATGGAGPQNPGGSQASTVQTVTPPPPPPPNAQTQIGSGATPAKSELVHAQEEISQLIKRYCSEYETLKTDGLKHIYPLAPVAAIKEQFKDYKSLKCTITSKEEYDRLPDPNPTGSSGAQLKFGMKQEIQIKKGGAPQIQETIVTMIVSRADFNSPWLIDRATHAPKPK